MKGISVNLLDPDLFFRFLKGRFHGNQFWAKFTKWPLFNTLAFWNGFNYRNFDSKRFNGNTFSTYCANFIARSASLLSGLIREGRKNEGEKGVPIPGSAYGSCEQHKFAAGIRFKLQTCVSSYRDPEPKISWGLIVTCFLASMAMRP